MIKRSEQQVILGDLSQTCLKLVQQALIISRLLMMLLFVNDIPCKEKYNLTLLKTMSKNNFKDTKAL